MVTFFMGQARHSLESLAVLPVINALVFIFRTPGLSYQEVAIALLGRSWDNLVRVRRFAGLLGLLATAGFAAIALTPLADVWLQRVSGLSPDLAAFAHTPLRIIVLMPALSVLLSLQRSLLVARRDHRAHHLGRAGGGGGHRRGAGGDGVLARLGGRHGRGHGLPGREVAANGSLLGTLSFAPPGDRSPTPPLG